MTCRRLMTSWILYWRRIARRALRHLFHRVGAADQLDDLFLFVVAVGRCRCHRRRGSEPASAAVLVASAREFAGWRVAASALRRAAPCGFAPPGSSSACRSRPDRRIRASRPEPAGSAASANGAGSAVGGAPRRGLRSPPSAGGSGAAARRRVARRPGFRPLRAPPPRPRACSLCDRLVAAARRGAFAPAAAIAAAAAAAGASSSASLLALRRARRRRSAPAGRRPGSGSSPDGFR